jgi:hypothetical protein
MVTNIYWTNIYWVCVSGKYPDWDARVGALLNRLPGSKILIVCSQEVHKSVLIWAVSPLYYDDFCLKGKKSKIKQEYIILRFYIIKRKKNHWMTVSKYHSSVHILLRYLNRQYSSSYCSIRFQIFVPWKKKLSCEKKLVEIQKHCVLMGTFIQNRLYRFFHQFELYLGLQ